MGSLLYKVTFLPPYRKFESVTVGETNTRFETTVVVIGTTENVHMKFGLLDRVLPTLGSSNVLPVPRRSKIDRLSTIPNKGRTLSFIFHILSFEMTKFQSKPKDT